MASVGFGTVAPAVASPAGGRIILGRRAAARTVVPAATKVVAAAKQQQQEEQKGLFDTILGALYKEEQLLETDPILNKVEGTKAKKATTGKKAAAEGSGGGGGFSFGGLFSSKE